MTTKPVRSNPSGSACWLLLLAAAASAPLVIPGCGSGMTGAGVILAGQSGGGSGPGGGEPRGGGASSHHDLEIDELGPQPPSQPRNDIDLEYQGIVAHLGAIRDELTQPGGVPRTDQDWIYLRAIDKSAERVGLNAVPYLTTADTVNLDVNAVADGDVYRFEPGGLLHVQIDGAPAPVQLQPFGSVTVDFVPAGAGWSGTVTDASIGVIHPSGDPTTLVVFRLRSGPEVAPSTVTLAPESGNPMLQRGTMRLVLDVHFGSPGDPVVALHVPVQTLDPMVSIHLTSEGPAPGAVFVPTRASAADPNADCNDNSLPDGPEITAELAADCNANGRPDECDIADERADDCNDDGRPDACELAQGDQFDTNANGVLEGDCELVDCDQNGIQDYLQLDEDDDDHDGFIDACELADCNGNGLPDHADLARGTSDDCDDNNVLDDCQLDSDSDGYIDVCESCDFDASKSELGVCGCGVEDTDNDTDTAMVCFDCNDDDASVVATPGEVQDERLSKLGTVARIDWPAAARASRYDVIRSSSRSDFVTGAVCIETDDDDLTADDAAVPAPGQAFYYLERPENGCPLGSGSLGTTSAGTPRVARGCAACPEGQACDDGFFCTQSETCHLGACQGGTPRSCDDGNVCSRDVCVEGADSCAHAPVADGTSCEDGLYCTVETACSLGTCAGGHARAGDDANLCTADTCNESTDTFDHPPVLAGTACDDGSFCTSGETCDGAGVCLAGPDETCDDGNDCSSEVCEELHDYCAPAPVSNGSPCEDPAFCSAGGSCSNGQCQDGLPIDCDDGLPCTGDACGEGANSCENPPLTAGADPDPASGCNGFRCDAGGQCATLCAGPGDCVDGYVCSGGACVELSENGTTCLGDEECASGFCTDGYCCNARCSGPCETCSQAPGACSPYPAGSDPENGCNGYVCDGAGACETTCSGPAECAPGYTCDLGSGQCGNLDVYAARVSGGAGLDPAGIAVAALAFDQARPAVSWNGSNFLIVWHDERTGVGQRDIYAARMSAGAVLLDAGGIAVSLAPGEQEEPAVAFGGADYLVVWTDRRSGNADIRASRVTAAGGVLDPAGIVVSNAVNDQTQPAVAFDGTNYLVVWTDQRSGARDIYGTRVTPTGVVLHPGGISISTAVGDQSEPALAFHNAAGHLVVWTDERTGTKDIYGTRVSAGGAVLDPPGIAITSLLGNEFGPAVAADSAGRFLVVWSEPGDARDVRGRQVLPSGALGWPVAVAGAPNDQVAPAVSYDGANFLVVWTDTRTGSSEIRGTRVDPAGIVLDPPGSVLVLPTGTELTDPALSVHWAGSTNLIGYGR